MNTALGLAISTRPSGSILSIGFAHLICWSTITSWLKNYYYFSVLNTRGPVKEHPTEHWRRTQCYERENQCSCCNQCAALLGSFGGAWWETTSSGEHFQPVLIKQTLTAQVPRAISSEIFEPCLWLTGPQQQPPDSRRSPPQDRWVLRLLRVTQQGKYSLQPGCQTLPLASRSCSHAMHLHTAMCPAYIFTTLLLQTGCRSVVQ